MKKIFLFIHLLCSLNLAHAQWPTVYFNTHYGLGAFASNTSGNYNAAFGNSALNKNITGNQNTAIGAWALFNANATGNVAIGRRAAYSTTTGMSNTAIGTNAMVNNISGLANVAIGNEAMTHNVGGYWNTAIGQSAGAAFDKPDLYNATAIGFYAINTANAQVRIGNEFVTDIGGQVSWSTLSDGRFKRDIKEDIAGLEFINHLRPVSYTLDEGALATFRKMPDSVKQKLQAARNPEVRQTGFVAQEVEELVKKKEYSFNGVKAPQNASDHYSIRYAEFVVPLVKAVQELAAMVEGQRKEILALKIQIDAERLKNGTTSEATATPQRAVLYQNHPNPFSTETEIGVSLPDNTENANLVFYTVDGKQLKLLHLFNRGDFTVKVDSNELTRGICFYALIVEGKIIDSKRLLVTK
ncbi:MAG TPA: tail fiber domain-containing protein [Chryseolinea sp.]